MTRFRARVDGVLNSRWFYGLALIAILGLLVFSQFEFRDLDSRPVVDELDLGSLRGRDDLNVLFILIDTLRADRLGVNGYTRDVSPNLDELAAHGIRFTQHLAQSSWTKSSMASLWTGLYPGRTGIRRYMHALPSEAHVPAEIMRDEGFMTAGIWRNGWVAPTFGFDQGFEAYSRPMPTRLSRELRREHPAATVAGSDADLALAAVEFMRSMGKKERWFLYLHMMDVHQYLSDEESAIFGTNYSDLYDNAIHWTDRNIGSLLAEMGRLGLLDRTLIVITSDHGEAFKEHGFEGHAKDLYGEVTEVPFLIGLPVKLKEGLVVDARTSNVDVWPTVLDLLGLPGLFDPDGRSLLPLIQSAVSGADGKETPPQFAELDTGWGSPRAESSRIFAVTMDDHRGHVGETGEFELYDLASDRREQNDISGEKPELSALLKGRIEEYQIDSESPWQVEEVELDDMMLNQLRALGYQIE